MYCRPRFYHRDMCIENIFLPYDTFPVTDNKTNTRQYENAYAEAKILLTRNTRCSNDPEAVENYGSIQAQRLVSLPEILTEFSIHDKYRLTVQLYLFKICFLISVKTLSDVKIPNI